MKNKVLVTLVGIIAIVVLFSNTIFADSNTPGSGRSINDVNKLGDIPEVQINNHLAEAQNDPEQKLTKFNTAVSKITGVIIVVLQIASVGGVIYAGVRYMFASADSKADIKKGLISLVIGMIIVFSASTVVGFITGTFKEIFMPLI